MSFFRSRWVERPDGAEELDPAQLAPGFAAAGIPCGIKPDGALDLGVVLCDSEGAGSAALLTSNAAAAAPIRVCRERCRLEALRSVVVNSGNANAATGRRGYEDAVAMVEAAAAECELDVASVAVASTGVIGEPLPGDRVRAGIGAAAQRLDPWGGRRFAKAILTTDRAAKCCSVTAGGVTVTAQAKGGGMVQPAFATTLCFVQTDALPSGLAERLRRAVRDSFERITVDGQQSTNDAIFMQASGASGRELPGSLLDAVLLQLAVDVVGDGEGATRVCRVGVSEAADAEEAERAARAIANSPLVQTALYGRDPNWGRAVQAAGMALAGEELELEAGSVDAAELAGEGAEVELGLRLGRGSARAEVYCSDLNHEYVRINAEYTT